ncbi:hypothetical protein HHI36_000357 [Cryptolaemus montrouzieri]|uniref:Uncharacterized protein n=1 Tax=Cryptolaemus montrouzieri TaxID=559131 RepID=A0ABD2P549_9CUCU
MRPGKKRKAISSPNISTEVAHNDQAKARQDKTEEQTAYTEHLEENLRMAAVGALARKLKKSIMKNTTVEMKNLIKDLNVQTDKVNRINIYHMMESAKLTVNNMDKRETKGKSYHRGNSGRWERLPGDHDIEGEYGIVITTHNIRTDGRWIRKEKKWNKITIPSTQADIFDALQRLREDTTESDKLAIVTPTSVDSETFRKKLETALMGEGRKFRVYSKSNIKNYRRKKYALRHPYGSKRGTGKGNCQGRDKEPQKVLITLPQKVAGDVENIRRTLERREKLVTHVARKTEKFTIHIRELDVLTSKSEVTHALRKDFGIEKGDVKISELRIGARETQENTVLVPQEVGRAMVARGRIKIGR